MFRLFTKLFVLFLLVVFTGSGVSQLSDEKIVVLYTEKDPIFPDLPKDCCKYQKIESFVNNGVRANTVILSGHGKPPEFAGYRSEKIAELISSYHPEMIVLNSCYGSSSPIMEELVKENTGAYVVASPFQIYLPGYVYEKDFFNFKLSTKQRAMAVNIKENYPTLHWQLNPKDLQKARETVFKMSKREIKQNLRRRSPPLIRVNMPNSLEVDSEFLVLLSKEELKQIGF